MIPNVLLLVLDAARRDALEPYGAAPGSTPAIAQLASRGKALPSVYATGCWTVPSHASFFTGLMPRAAGLSRVPSPSASKPVLASHSERLLPEVLRRAGYSTGGVSANLWISPESGFDLGFEAFEPVDSGRHAQFGDPSRRARLRWLAEAAAGRADDGADAISAALTRRIAASGGRPFFAFANVIECHSPYLPPRPYGDVSTLDRVRAAEEAQRYWNLNAIWRAGVGGLEVPSETLDRMRRLYRGAIRFLDDWVGRLLERLDTEGALDDTLVLLISDHGENFGEGGLLAHALSLDNRLIHVPFVAAGPGAERLTITSLADLPRAIAESTGVDDHPWRDGPPPGVGVAQFDPPIEDPDDPRVVETVERWGLGLDARRRFTEPLTAAVAGDLKLVRRGEREELFDLADDPLELSPRSPDSIDASRADQVAALRRALEHPAMTSVRPESSSAAAAGPPSQEELSDIEERMKLLGYM
ncbi:MAG TPA: sulfatase [Thermoleophilaceae bacterium]|jgi:arylsulfatase A-like enzyme